MGRKIQVLLVDPVPEMLRLMDAALSHEPDMAVVGAYTTGEEALRSLGEPDVVVVAHGLPDVESTGLVWQITSEHPYLPVIALGPPGDQALMRRFMVVGARGYVGRPVDFEDLRNTIRAVYQKAMEERAARLAVPQTVTGMLDGGVTGQGLITAIFGAKGGVGKTVVAVNLALALQETTEQRVGLVDADFAFGDAALQLDLNPTHSFLNLVEHLEEEKGHVDPQYVRGIMARHPSGLRVLCRPSRPEHAELIKAEHVEAALRVLPMLFPFVVVDCWLSYDDRMLAVLDASDAILFLMAPEIGAVANTVTFLELAEALGYGDRVHLVLNRANTGVGIEKADVEKALKRRVDFALPSVGSSLALSINQGRPLFLRDRRSPFCQAVLEMARFLTTVAEAKAPPRKAGQQAPR
ncbi:MAG: response regulator [Anaerolineae bacterium]